MAKYDFDVAFAAAPQTQEGSYDTTLDGITTALRGDPDGTDDGLVLGDPSAGIGESGLSFTAGRRSRDKAVLSGGFTRPLSDFLAAEVRTLSFAFPFCGNRGTASTPPVDGDFQPLRGVEAILNGAGLVAAAWGGGVGYSCKFGSPSPFSILLWYFGNRLELLDCRCSSLSLNFTPGSIAVATAQIVVGSIKDPSAKGFSPVVIPTTLDYGPQADVSAPTIESVGHAWQETKGFQALDLVITPTIDDVLDSNATDGILKLPSARETKITATLFADDTDKVMELDQMFATAVGDLDQLSFQVGASAASGDTMVAVQVLVPTPEGDDTAPQKLGTRAGNTVNLIARNSTVNEELELIFR